MKKTMVLMCLIASAALAGSGSYSVTLDRPALVGGTELKSGEYKVEIKDQKVIFHSRQASAEATARVETNGTKFRANSVVYAGSNGSYRMEEIDLGGTTTKLVLDTGSAGGVNGN